VWCRPPVVRRRTPAAGFATVAGRYSSSTPRRWGAVINEFAERNEVLLQGRRTYQMSAAAWPERRGDPFADWINRAQKYVVSDTLTDGDLTWQPATINRSADLLDSVAALRDKPGGDIYLYGSVSVVRFLTDRGVGRRARPHDRTDNPRWGQDRRVRRCRQCRPRRLC
jgi:hypothetical protein